MKQPQFAAANATLQHGGVETMPLFARLGDLVRERGLIKTIAHCRTIFLLRAHEMLFDRGIEKLERVQTAGYVPLENLTIDSVNKPLDNADIHYLPTPVMVLRWVFKLLPHRYEGTTFVDFGSGRGRVLLCAAQYPFKKITGVEFAAELHDAASQNLGALAPSHIKCARIENHLGDAANFAIPEGETVLFFFNPFEAQLMARIRDRIAASHRADPRPITVVYVNPKQHHVFDEDPSFDRLPLSAGAAIKFAALSPFQVKLYRVSTQSNTCEAS